MSRHAARYLIAASAQLLFVLACEAPPPPQTQAPDPFRRLLARHFDSLQRDTLVQRVTGAKTGREVFASVPRDAFWRLSNADLVSFAGLLGESLQQVDSVTCARFAPGGPGFQQSWPDLVSKLDSSRAARWVLFFDRLAHTGFTNAPLGPMVSSDQAHAGVLDILNTFAPDEMARVQQALEKPDGSAADRCLFAIRFNQAFADMTPSRAGPLFRGIMGQPPK